LFCFTWFVLPGLLNNGPGYSLIQPLGRGSHLPVHHPLRDAAQLGSQVSASGALVKMTSDGGGARGSELAVQVRHHLLLFNRV
jgi:hypothetical protein